MDKRLADIADRWDKVEHRIKEIEQISKEARIPAINELRYAGRQLVDAIRKILAGKSEDIEANIQVAEQFVRNADHDVTDAILDYMKSRIDRSLLRFGQTTVLNHFPYATEMKDRIADAEKTIKESRRIRQQRDAAYEKVYNDHISRLVDKFAEFEKVEPKFGYDAALIEAELKISKGFNKIVGIITILSFAVSLFFWTVPFSEFIGWFSSAPKS